MVPVLSLMLDMTIPEPTHSSCRSGALTFCRGTQCLVCEEAVTGCVIDLDLCGCVCRVIVDTVWIQT